METGEWYDVRELAELEDGAVVVDVFGRAFVKRIGSRGTTWEALRSDHCASIGPGDRVLLAVL